MKKNVTILTLTSILLATAVVARSGEEPVSITEAISAATAAVPGKVVRAELRRGLYEVRIRTEEGRIHEVFVDARSGTIVNRHKISLDEAVDAAEKAVPGKIIKIEFERGRYEIKIKTAGGDHVEVYVDAGTGEVARTED